MVPLARSWGSSGFLLLPRLPPPASDHPAWALPHPRPDLSGCHCLVMGLFPPTLDQELAKSPWALDVSLALPWTGPGPEEISIGKFLLNEQVKRPLHLPEGSPDSSSGLLGC